MPSMSDAEIFEAAMDGRLDEDGNINDSQGSSALQPGQPNDRATDASQQESSGTAAVPTDEGEKDEAGDLVGAPITSKSGGYTIDYQKLADARSERDALREQVAALKQQIAGLTAQQQQNLATAHADAQDRADAGQAKTQADANLDAATQAISQGLDVSVFGDFSEEAIARGVAELNRRAFEQMRVEMQETIRREMAPIQQKEAKTTQSAHADTILQAYPDVFEIVESSEFDAWRNSLPAFARAGVEHAITSGSPKDVIEVFDTFSAQRKPVATTPVPSQVEQAAARVPISLSEVPGAPPIDETQQTLAMAGNAEALLDRMANMTSEQIDALMDRI